MRVSGKNAVLEALKSDLTVEKVVIQSGQNDKTTNEIISLAKSKGIKISFLDKRILDRIDKEKNNQGVSAEITDYRYYELEDITAIKGKDRFLIILDGIEDPHNLGSIIRTAECSGIDGIIIPKHRSVGVNDTVIKVSTGAAAYAKVCRVVNINDAIRKLKDDGYKIIAAEADGESIYTSNLKGDVAVVIGGEDSGIKRLTKSLCDITVSLPMFGKINSLNASVACGAVLYEAIRQRKGY